MMTRNAVLFVFISALTFSACDTVPSSQSMEEDGLIMLTEESPIEYFTVTSNLEWDAITRTIDGIEMVLVPPGCFPMGITEEQVIIDQDQCDQEFTDCFNVMLDNESPQNEVCFEEPFWLDRTEVTNGQYGSSSTLDPALPRTIVNWVQAQEYCEGRGGSLPTEAEWEYAARGPDGWRYPWGNEFGGNLANFCDVSCARDWASEIYSDGFEEMAPVGSIPLGASWVGAFDMSGNVTEWVYSTYLPYPYNAEDGREADLAEDSSSERGLRGASFSTIPTFLRLTSRFRAAVTFLNQNIGVRCMLPYDE